MNNEEILKAMNDIDEKFLKEAEEQTTKKVNVILYIKRVATVCAVLLIVFFGSVQANKDAIKEKLFNQENVEYVPKETASGFQIINAYFPSTEEQSTDKIYLKYMVNNEEKEVELVRRDKNEKGIN